MIAVVEYGVVEYGVVNGRRKINAITIVVTCAVFNCIIYGHTEIYALCTI